VIDGIRMVMLDVMRRLAFGRAGDETFRLQVDKMVTREARRI
jgi:hypothetical protein